MNVIQQLEKEQQKEKVPALRAGDTVKVHAKVVEGTRERIQVFEGTVIRVTGGGLRQNFTVRRVTHGVGVERTFLIHSPRIEKIDVLRHGDVRQADRKSTRLNSSHTVISYAVFCLKKKKNVREPGETCRC